MKENENIQQGNVEIKSQRINLTLAMTTTEHLSCLTATQILLNTRPMFGKLPTVWLPSSQGKSQEFAFPAFLAARVQSRDLSFTDRSPFSLCSWSICLSSLSISREQGIPSCIHIWGKEPFYLIYQAIPYASIRIFSFHSSLEQGEWEMFRK